MSNLVRRFGFLVALAFLVNSTAGHAAAALPKSKKQTFALDTNPKIDKPAFINFKKLKNNSDDPRGKVKFKPKVKKKKADAVIKFGEPIAPPAGGGSSTVDIELVSLSLVSAQPVSLDNFFDDQAAAGQSGKIVLSLDSRSIARKVPLAFDSPLKKKGTFDVKFDKILKISAEKKVNDKVVEKSKTLPATTFSANGVPFSHRSPIMATAPFCLDSGDAAQICLRPLSTPEPATSAMLGLSIAAGLTLFAIRRRRASVAVSPAPA